MRRWCGFVRERRLWKGDLRGARLWAIVGASPMERRPTGVHICRAHSICADGVVSCGNVACGKATYGVRVCGAHFHTRRWCDFVWERRLWKGDLRGACLWGAFPYAPMVWFRAETSPMERRPTGCISVVRISIRADGVVSYGNCVSVGRVSICADGVVSYGNVACGKATYGVHICRAHFDTRRWCGFVRERRLWKGDLRGCISVGRIPYTPVELR